ncbi:hypothetical protein Pmani_012288 [Petrolisthes manimaculis]|uniref:Uncharacterized protein n=1 Tax=Petrolisthes manimaculis TaxID=1843537 RepID=A0AAE1UAM2_9EUCA|nr:hypothetical protein Pmani_012288 [Petrolisthes manimaculis]
MRGGFKTLLSRLAGYELAIINTAVASVDPSWPNLWPPQSIIGPARGLAWDRWATRGERLRRRWHSLARCQPHEHPSLPPLQSLFLAPTRLDLRQQSPIFV